MEPADVRRHFAGYAFGEPCPESELVRAEALLGELVPDVLRELYRSFNGFAGPTSAPFLWPLFERRRGASALVEMNLFLRHGSEFPRALMLQCLFYGDAGVGPSWGLKRDLPGKVILWDAEWGDDFEVVGDDLLEVWMKEKRAYEELA